MLVYNIKDFDSIELYQCLFEEHSSLLIAGFTPIYFDDRYYYYLLDDSLKEYIDKRGGVLVDG